ncbi:MAG: PAS domain S-box protein [Ignavibacteria bacterium]|jgi:PAS domain S-box-containing protein|nr:PAS domain S-box protein [Ignavibacteria bacterium]MCU7502095.1 PAS domain S-box protein [Ignavibacteria bacterium]MCU7515497.1 PAS domain S-box protein [Ignavibacteria bacterium]
MDMSHTETISRNDNSLEKGELLTLLENLIDPFALIVPEVNSVENKKRLIVSFSNEAAAKHLGLEQIKGKDFMELFPEKHNVRLIGAIHEVLEKHVPAKITSMPYKTNTGRERGRLDVSISPFDKGIALCWKESISVTKKNEELLQTLERERAWFNSVMAQMPSGVSIAEAPSGRLLYHNEQGIRLIRHPLLPSDDYTGYVKYGAMHDAETPYALEEYPMVRAIKGEAVLGEEVLYRRGDGTFTYLSINAAPVKNADGEIIAAVSTFDDISEKKRAEAEIEESKRILDALMEFVPEGITIADSQAVNIRMVSRYGEEKLGGAHGGLTAGAVAEKWKVFYPDGVTEMPAENLPLVRAVKNGEEVIDAELIQVNSRGQAMHLLCNAAPIRSRQGEVTGGIVAWRDITERKNAEEALRESERRFKELAETLEIERAKLAAIIENLPAGVGVSDPFGKVISLNRTGLVMHGSRSEEFTSMDVDEYMREFDLFYTNGKIMPVEEWPVLRAVKGEFVKNYELRLHHKKNGYERILSYSVDPVYNSQGEVVLIIFVIVDITERKQAEESLELALQHLKFHVENSPLAVVEFNNDYQVTSWSGKAEEIFGWRAEEVLGKKISDFKWVHDEDAKRVAELSSAMFASQKTSNIHTNRNYRKDGSIITCEWYNSALVDSEGNLVSVLSLVLDITQRENTLQQLEETLKNLERSNRELEQFAYVASHDLQEPLRIISNYTQMLSRRYKDKIDERANQLIEFIIEGSMRMKALIEDLLSFSRITTKGENRTLTDLNLVMQNVMDDLKVTIEENNARINFGVLPVINADTTQIRQVFQNLISNAIKFRGMDDPEISIGAERKEKQWCFSVKDNGIGIAREFFDKIFIIFQRLHDREAYPGTGIGLAICKRIVEHHGGNIRVESEEGKGSTFYFTIPA